MARPKIFISYRRDDTAGHAGRLYDRLAERFGPDRVYRDIDAGSAGEDFAETIRRRVAECDVMLVLIGPRWLTATDDAGEWRLAQESDWVREEIATALERNVRLIPVLMHGAKMPPAAALPAALTKLAHRNAVEIRDTAFDADVSQLVSALEPGWRHWKWLRTLRRPIAWTVPAVLVVAAAIAAVYMSQVSISPEQARARLTQLDFAYTPDAFVKAAELGDAQAIDLFLRAGMEANVKNRRGATALNWASAKGNVELMKVLLKRGAEAESSLSWAAGNGRSEAVDLLLKHIDRKSPAVSRALISASKDGNPELVRTLLERGADVNARDENGYTALMAATERGHAGAARLLLERGADARRTIEAGGLKGWTALHGLGGQWRAVPDELQEKRIAAARLVLGKGADVNARTLYANGEEGGTWTPLLIALHNELWLVARFLIENGADVNAQTDARWEPGDRTALMFAVEKKHRDTVEALLAKGADVNRGNTRGDTPLSLAAITQVLPLVDMLLAHGAKADAANHEGWTPLMHAVSARGSRPTIDSPRPGGPVAARLIEKGANVNARSKTGHTALIMAAERDEREGLEVLLAHGADIDAATAKGNTALMVAAWADNVEIVRALLARGANARARNIDAETALDVARREKSNKVIAPLAAAVEGRGNQTVRR